METSISKRSIRCRSSRLGCDDGSGRWHWGGHSYTAFRGGGENASDDISSTLRNQLSTTAIYSASYFYAIGIAAHGDNKTEAWRTARSAVAAVAPAGDEYDPEFTTTRYVDTSSGYPIYVSDDGQSYSIGGNVVSKTDYDNSNRKSFYSSFGTAWNAL